VRPLPKEGELPGFTGAIGNISMEPLKTGPPMFCAVGDPVKLSVTIRGRDQLARLVAARHPPSARLANPFCDCEGEPAQLLQAQGFRQIRLHAMPDYREAHATPRSI